MTTPKAPSHLSRRARKLWREINRDFEMEPESLATLQVALENLDIGDRARAIIDAEGLVVEGKRNPAVDILKQANSLFLRAMRELKLDTIDVVQRSGRGGR